MSTDTNPRWLLAGATGVTINGSHFSSVARDQYNGSTTHIVQAGRSHYPSVQTHGSRKSTTFNSKREAGFTSKLVSQKVIVKTGILRDLRHLVECVLEDQEQLKKVLECGEEDAQSWLDALQVLANLSDISTNLRSSILKLMLRLSKNSGLIPHCLKIENAKKLGDGPVAFGGFGDVWKGKIGRQTVCLKVTRAHQVSDASRMLKLEFMREAIVWQQLEHPNLLPFLGIYYLDETEQQLCLVSPWMERGNLFDFLQSEDVDHYSLVSDIASGLSYLHSKEIVHGDLKSLNILMTPEGRACITDFGFSRVRGTHLPGLTSSNVSGGTTRYSAPELLESAGNFSIYSDMYAFGCVCYEIFEGNVPFHELKFDGAVILAVANNRRPSRPNTTLLNDEMWNVVVACWNAQPDLRPQAVEVLNRIASLYIPNSNAIGPGASWDTFDPIQIWREGKYRYPPLSISTLTQLQRSIDISADN